MTPTAVTLTHAGHVTPLREASPAHVLGAPARYKELELRHRRLLAALAAHDGAVPNAHLAAAAHIPPKIVFGLMVRLCEVGMARQTPQGWQLEDAIVPLAQADLSESVHIALVLPATDVLRLPCASDGERRVLQALVHLFPGCAVMSNVLLSHVIDAGVARLHLGEPAYQFLRNRAELDAVVYSGATLKPVLAVETDGPQHDVSPQDTRDGLKNTICRVAGLPLLRVRVYKATSQEILMRRLGRALHEVARSPRVEQRGHQEFAEALARLA